VPTNYARGRGREKIIGVFIVENLGIKQLITHIEFRKIL